LTLKYWAFNGEMFLTRITTFVTIEHTGTRISFTFGRCRYLSIFGILLLTKIRYVTKIANIVTISEGHSQKFVLGGIKFWGRYKTLILNVE